MSMASALVPITKEEQVLIRGKCFLYKQKAPFVPSGVSVAGALEYDEETDKVRCHECGRWFVWLTSHLKSHSMDAREYKRKHGLRMSSSLVGVRYAAALSKAADSPSRRMGMQIGLAKCLASGKHSSYGRRPMSEFRNENASCPAQLLERIRTLGRMLGKCPSRNDMLGAGISPASALLALNLRSLRELQLLANFIPNEKGNPKKYSDSLLIELLRDFYVKHSRFPVRSDFGFGLLPSRSTFIARFGSWRAVCEAAGFGLVAKQGGAA